MKSLFLSVVLLFLFVLICLASDLNGNWQGIVKVPDGDVKVTCKFKTEGKSLTGFVLSSYGELPVLNGKITDSTFTFTLELENNVMPCKGKFYGDSLIIQTEIQGSPVKSVYKRIP